MRHNLTNIAETQLDKVDSFYVVGSTTKEGLIEGRSNVKIDLKKAISDSGKDDDADISLGEALIKVYRMYSDPHNITEAMPDKFLIIAEGVGNLFSLDTITWEEEGITPPSGLVNTRIYIIPDEGSVYVKEIDAITDNDVHAQYIEVHPLVSLEKFNEWGLTYTYIYNDNGRLQEVDTSDRFAIKYGSDIYITNVYGD